jgi:hypothetical protein
MKCVLPLGVARTYHPIDEKVFISFVKKVIAMTPASYAHHFIKAWR